MTSDGRAHLLARCEMAEPEEVALTTGRCVCFSTPMPGKEGPNEDALLVLPCPGVGTVLAVADGAGGLAQGERAALLALESLRDGVGTALDDGQDLRVGILNGFEAANRAVLEIGGSGSTLVAVEVTEDSVRPYHVGDSEALLTGQRAKVKLHTVSHSPVGYAYAAGMLTEKEAMQHENRHLVSNLLGSEDMHIQVGPVTRLGPRDTLVLASDGLFDNAGRKEIVDLARKGPLPDAARELARLARDRMEHPREGRPSKLDDLTLILFRPVAAATADT